MDVYKILVIGDPKTGKTSLIQAFMNSDAGSAFAQSKNLGALGSNGGQMDFVLKILNLPEHGKVRVQLWENAGASGDARHRASTHLAPLFIRNAVACVVVARAD